MRSRTRSRGEQLFVALLAVAGGEAAMAPRALAADTEPAAQDGAASILVLDLADEVGDPATGQRLSSIFRGELGAVLGARLAAPDPSPDAEIYHPCPSNGPAACAMDKGRRAGAALVVGGEVGADPALVSVELWVMEVAQGRVVKRVRGRIGSDQSEWPRALRALGVRAAAPERYVGHLEVSELQVFDRLLINGLEVPVEVPTTRVTLPVGSHVVELDRVGTAALREVIEVGYDQEVRLPRAAGSDARANTAAATRPAGDGSGSIGAADEDEALAPWLGYGALGVGVAGIAVGAGFLAGYLLFTAPQLDFAAQQRDAGSGCSGGGDDCWELRAAELESSAGLQLGLAATGLIVGLTALAGGGWLLYTEHAEDTRGD